MLSTDCGWCGRYANMTPANKETWVKTPENDNDILVIGTFTCDHCHRYLIAYGHAEYGVLRYANSPSFSQVADGGLSWIPTRGMNPPAFEDVPAHIAEAAQEAFRTESIGCYRSATLMARSVVEASAKEKGITTGRLIDKIDRMGDLGYIRADIKEAAHEVRHLGNEMAHGDFTWPIGEEESNLILTLMTEILNDAFQSPARVARAREARMARVQGSGN